MAQLGLRLARDRDARTTDLASVRRSAAPEARSPRSALPPPTDEHRASFDLSRYAIVPSPQPPVAMQYKAAEPNRTGLPDRLKAGIETLAGFSIDDVRVHRNSRQPARLGALAYAQGSDIHLASGQERHLPHEAWHVVQQKQGRVRPTHWIASQGVNSDHMLEQEADRMGEQALRQPTGGHQPMTRNAVGAGKLPAQLKNIDTGSARGKGGVFSNPVYSGFKEDGDAGANVQIDFMPADEVQEEAQSIGMIQTNRRTVMERERDKNSQGEVFLKPKRRGYLTEIEKGRAVFGRTHIDRRDEGEKSDYRQNNPVYQSADNAAAAGEQSEFVAKWLDEVPQTPEHHGQLWQADQPDRPAILKDKPLHPVGLDTIVVDKFETVAVILAGDGKGRHLGSVKWGWEVQPGGNVVMRAFEKGESANAVSVSFKLAARAWNQQTIPKQEGSEETIPTLQIPLLG